MPDERMQQFLHFERRPCLESAQRRGVSGQVRHPCSDIRKNLRRNIARFLDTGDLARPGRALDAREPKWPEAVAAFECWRSPAAPVARCPICAGTIWATARSPLNIRKPVRAPRGSARPGRP